MTRLLALLFSVLFSFSAYAAGLSDMQAVERAARDYIESQYKASPALMERGVHKKLKKRTFWVNKDGEDFVMESDYEFMVKLAETYNRNGDRFPSNPKIDIKILDIDQRVASVKLTADDWIDYMHLMKSTDGNWKIINVLWQYHDTTKHSSKE